MDDRQETLLSCYLPRKTLLPPFYCRLWVVYDGLMNLTWKPSNQVTGGLQPLGDVILGRLFEPFTVC